MWIPKSISIIKRVYYYLSGSKNNKIEIHDISRDGGFEGISGSIYDTGAFQILLLLSILYSNALEPLNPPKFKTKDFFPSGIVVSRSHY